MKKNVKSLIFDTMQMCIYNKITFKLDHREYTYVDGGPCCGFVDENRFCVAVGKAEIEWLKIFVHESCHIDQLLEKDPLWESGCNGYDGLGEQLKSDESLSKENVKNIILLEKDCDQRAVKKINKYGLNIDRKTYIQQSNSYLFSYWMVCKTKKWVPGIYTKMDYKKLPSVFLKEEEYMNPNKKYLDLFEEFY